MGSLCGRTSDCNGNADLFFEFSVEYSWITWELPLKNDDFLLKTGDSFAIRGTRRSTALIVSRRRWLRMRN